MYLFLLQNGPLTVNDWLRKNILSQKENKVDWTSVTQSRVKKQRACKSKGQVNRTLLYN